MARPATRQRGRGTLFPVPRRFNPRLCALASALLAVAGPSACKKDELAPDAGATSAPPPTTPAPALGTPPAEVVAAAPEPPAALGVRLGDSALEVQKARPAARPDELTTAILLEELPGDGPFRLATYLLSRDASPRLETLILTLRTEYAHPAHVTALSQAIGDKLGKGRTVAHEGFQGEDWPTPGVRLELRQDTRHDNEVELVYDLRGARSIEMP